MLVSTMGADDRERGEPMSDPGLACCTPLTGRPPRPGAPVPPAQAGRFPPLLKALADPVRLRLVSLIAASAGGEACVCDLNAAFELTQATISHHLKVLHSAGLVTVVIGSGIAAQRLSPGDVGLQLLENALATGAGLVALILAFGPVSGGHFNPVITLADRFFGGLPNRSVAVYLPAQLVGGVVGALLANLMFGLPAVSISGKDRSASGLWLSEAVATFGLVVLVFAVVRSGRAATAP